MTMADDAMRSGNSTPLHGLVELGQSPWLDSIDRGWLVSGELERMLGALSITGVTSNPTIFEQALRGGAYDSAVLELLGEGLDDEAVFERLEVEDIRGACDLLAEVHERSGGRDGMVSIELEPDIADDADASVARGLHLWQLVDRPNLMVKVPATDAALPAIEELLVRGVNVNVTLLFGVEVYRAVMERHLRALERRADGGADVGAVHSVASFFVSRVDTAVDALLEQHGEAGEQLRGRIAVANALVAYDAHRQVYGGERARTLLDAGAAAQRPLWASTGTKNPAYSDVLYVQELVAPGTVNTMPLGTMRAFADHGRAEVTVTDTAIDQAHADLAALADLGIDLDAVTAKLRTDGIAAFQASYDQLIERIAGRRSELANA